MNVVSRSITFARKLAEVRELAQSIKDEIAALGGVSVGTDSYFLDDNGDPRTDLEVSQTAFSAILTTGNTLLTTLDAGHRTNIYNVVNGK
jgi:hypothetical protein